MSWRTRNEIDFIKGIGSYRSKKPRLELLKGYKQGALKRDRWGEIDKEEVFRFVEAEIHNCK